MTSDCAGDQVSHGPDGSTSVKATGTIGSHDRLNEAPQDVFEDFCLSFLERFHHWPDEDQALLKEMAWQSFRAGYYGSLAEGICKSLGDSVLRDGQPARQS